ncbi:MAG: GAF domain-containing protein [Armatimonadetes bacterium]|nr:GAF domain-containing protein [Armatimonadota bacterium]
MGTVEETRNRRTQRFVASLLELDDLLALILQEALAALGADRGRGLIALRDRETGKLRIKHTAGAGWDEVRKDLSFYAVAEKGKGIIGLVAATGMPYLSGDVTQDPYYYPVFGEVRSEIAAPLIDRHGQVIGVLNLETNRVNDFDEHNLRLLQALTDQAAIAVEVAQCRARERVLMEINRELVSLSDAESVFTKVVNIAADILEAQDSSLFLFQEDRQWLVLEASRGVLSREAHQARYAPGEGLTGWVAQRGEPIRSSDVREDPRWKGLHREFPENDATESFLAVPVRGRDSILGVLRVVRRPESDAQAVEPFTPDDQSLLQMLASQVGIAIENARLLNRLVRSERMAAWGEMSARSAHMIGNRVFAIKGDLNEMEYLCGQPQADGEAMRGLVESVKRGLFRLEELLNEFRDFVMATQLSKSPQDINEVIRQTAQESFPKRSPVRLALSLAPGIPPVEADSTKLKRCFSELIENALDFQPEGGELLIRTGMAAREDIREVCALPMGRELVRIEFLDAGPGVPEENKARIFIPYLTTRSKGMGLGLSIVKGIIEAHRGTICEIGEPGRGARFLILLPVRRQECGGKRPPL